MNTLDEILNAEAIAELMLNNGAALKAKCHQARKKLQGVSTPGSARKGINHLIVNQALQARERRLVKSGRA